jgi:hypothetical protein
MGDGQRAEAIPVAHPGEGGQSAQTSSVPAALVDAVVADFDPVQVILFGPRNRLGWRSAFDARKDFHRAVDIVPCRQRWFEDKRNVIGSLAHMAAEDGIVVYERH